MKIIQELSLVNKRDLDKTILMPSIANALKKEKKKEKKNKRSFLHRNSKKMNGMQL